MKICSTNIIPPSIPSSRKHFVSNNGNQNLYEHNKTYAETANSGNNQGKISFLA